MILRLKPELQGGYAKPVPASAAVLSATLGKLSECFSGLQTKCKSSYSCSVWQYKPCLPAGLLTWIPLAEPAQEAIAWGQKQAGMARP